jgi:hypothetical protein
MRATNKRLLISESRGDSNRCTPYSGKPDQHNTYASHASPCMLGVCLLRVVPIRGNLSCSHQQIWTDPLPLKKKGSWHNPQHASWPIYGSVPSFSPTIANEAVGTSQASIENWLLELLGPYHRHAVGTFNTCSRGPTHQSLTDSGGGYNLEGAGFPCTTPRRFQPAVFTFQLRALLDL